LNDNKVKDVMNYDNGQINTVQHTEKKLTSEFNLRAIETSMH